MLFLSVAYSFSIKSRRLPLTGLLTAVLMALLTVTASADLANRKINSTLPPFGGVRDYVLSPDGQWVVYTAYQDSDLTEAMFRVPSDGSSPPVQVNDPLPLGDYFDFFAITPDSSRVVYLAQSNSSDFELYSAPLDGSAAPIILNPPLVSGGQVYTFFFSPDGSRVIYRAMQETVNMIELYSVPIDGSSPAFKLNAPLVSNGDVNDMAISPDGSRVVYIAD